MRIQRHRGARLIVAALATIGLIGSIAAVPAEAATAPSAPTLLATTAGGPGVGEVTLRWSAPANDGDSPITTYRFQVSTNGGTTWGAITDLNTTGTSKTVPCSAFPAGTCTYRLYASNAIGNSVASAPVNVITGVPDAPSLKTASIPGPSVGNVTLRWAKPSNTGGAAITTYKYEVSTNGGTTWGPKVSAATTSTQKVVPCSAFPLGACTYRLSATNSRGDSVASNTITIAATVTKAPVLKTTSAVGPALNEVTLLWAKPSQTGGAAITTFKYELSTNGGTTFGPKVDMATTGTSKVVPCPVLPAGACTYRIVATNAIGDSLPSNTITRGVGVSGAPELKTTSTSGPSVGNVVLKWAKPGDTGGLPITTFKYELSTNGGTTWGPKVDMGTTTTGKTVPCAAFPAGSCTYRITATTAFGDSAPSNALTFSALVPKAPSLNPTSKLGPGLTEVTLKWGKSSDTGGAAITTFKYDVSTDGGTTWSTKTDLLSTTLSAVVPCPALPLGACTYRVYTTNAVGDSPASNAITLGVQVPAAPGIRSTTASGPTVGDVTLRWNLPTSDGGSPVTTYKYDVSTNGGTSWSAKTDLASTELTAVVPCAAFPAGTCTFRIYATNVLGDSLPSTPIALSVEVPDAARAVNVDTTDNVGAIVNWVAPFDSGGAAVSYRVEVSNDAGGSWLPVATNLAVLTYTDTTGCTSQTACLYRVVATNSAGDAPASSSANFAVVPTTPRSLSVTKVDDLSSGEATMDLSWVNSRWGLVSGYTVEQCPRACTSSFGTFTTVATAASSPLTFGCEAGLSTCTFRVRAENANGGAPGPWAYHTYQPTAPFNVSAVSGPDTGTISVTFSGPGLAGSGDPRFYQFWVCTTACSEDASWSLSPVTVSYPPAQSPTTAVLPCATGVFCAVRAQFVAGPTARTSMLSAIVSAAGA